MRKSKILVGRRKEGEKPTVQNEIQNKIMEELKVNKAKLLP